MLLLPILPAVGAGIWRQAGQWSERTLFFENPLSLCLGGVALWFCFALFFHLPSRVYVFAHELTHALFVKLCGGKVKKISVKRDSGYILSDADNFLITLAPYLFPFYAMALGLAAVAAACFIPVSRFEIPLWAGIGLGLGYHWHMTGRMLLTQQSDFASQGYFFSFVLILLVNLSLLLLLLLLLPAPLDFPARIRDVGRSAAGFYAEAWRWILSLWREAAG